MVLLSMGWITQIHNLSFKFYIISILIIKFKMPIKNQKFSFKNTEIIISDTYQEKINSKIVWNNKIN